MVLISLPISWLIKLSFLPAKIELTQLPAAIDKKTK
jgi:hypothetical protein